MRVRYWPAIDGKGDEIGTGLTERRASDSDPGMRYFSSDLSAESNRQGGFDFFLGKVR